MSVEGWQPDPFGIHEERLFSQGEPTALVRDGGVGSYHEPPSSPSASPAAAPQPVPAPPAPPMAPAPQVIPTVAPAPAPAPAVPVTSQPQVTWTTLATTGSLVLAQSEHEFAVYDQTNNFGRWPRTDQGYRFASETYTAHAQSLARGTAYPTVGYGGAVAPGQSVTPVPSQYPVPGRQDPGSNGTIGKDRSPASVLGLSLITFGIYFLVWYHHINAEIKRHDPDIKVTPAWCVVAAIVPIANVISAYSTAARIRQMQLDDGQTDTISPVVALLLVIFLGIGYPLYIASQLREHWHGHRRSAQSLPS